MNADHTDDNNILRSEPSPIAYGITLDKLKKIKRKDLATDKTERHVWLLIIAAIFITKIRGEYRAGHDVGEMVGNVIMFSIIPGFFIYIGVFIIASAAIVRLRNLSPSWRKYLKYKQDHEQWAKEVERSRLLMQESKDKEIRKARELQRHREIEKEKSAIGMALIKLNSQERPAMEELRVAFASKQWNSSYYRAYQKTKHWVVTRKMALDRAGHRCQVCGRKNHLQVHHNSYERLGCEAPEDLVVLCSLHHEMIHTKSMHH